MAPIVITPTSRRPDYRAQANVNLLTLTRLGSLARLSDVGMQLQRRQGTQLHEVGIGEG